MSTNTEFMVETINEKIRGGVIRNAIISDDKESFGFAVVVKGEGRGVYDVINVWVDCDAEGNGPGWLGMEDSP